ncbi:MAG: oxidoreductase [Oscillochloris sp.]|nr:oxidoreductase [Oscillochloris sp.]
MTSETIRVGLIGYGYAGKTFHAPLIAADAGLVLAAIASRDPAKVHADWPDVAVVPSPQALLERDDIDLVVIATPNITHYPLAQAGLIAGKHVVVDKPFTTTVTEAETLAELAVQRECVLSVFHNRRWDGDFLTLCELVQSGELGEIMYLESHYDRFRPLVRDRWREQVGPGSGIWFDLGAHVLDQAIQLFGLPDALQADIVAQRPGARVDDYFHVQLHYGARRVVLHGSSLVAAPGPRFIVHGRNGSFLKYGLDPQEDALKAGIRPGTEGWGDDPLPGLLTTVHGDAQGQRRVPTIPGNYPAFYQGVRKAILGQAPNPVPPAEAISVMRLLELAQQHSLEDRKIARI